MSVVNWSTNALKGMNNRHKRIRRTEEELERPIFNLIRIQQ
jgi:hypothetical protein